MAKIGRNDLCHCNSGKKYKKCCMASDEAAARVVRPAQPAAVPARPPSLASYAQEHDERDELTEASNAVVDMVCEARGDHRQAADYYRKAINVIRNHPDNYDPGFEAVFQRLIDRIEPKADDAAD